MRKKTSITWFVGIAVVSASCAQIVGMEDGVLRQDGPDVECEVFEDCLQGATECLLPEACSGGTCQYKFTTRGFVLATQTPGDCKKITCDGQGSTELVVDTQDIEDDKNECTIDSCNNDTPLHTPVPMPMVDCYEGPPGTKGVGVCVGGTQTCNAQGEPTSPCEGQIVPQPEVCDAAKADEDCNGMANESGSPEGGTCTCGDMAISPGINESCDDGNAIGGDGCSPVCSTVQTVQVAAGFDSTCVLLSDGTIKCWGANYAGQLGIGSMTTIGGAMGQMGSKLAVAPLPQGTKALRLEGQSTFCALLDDQTLRCWGANESGQLGEGVMPLAHRGDGPNEMGDQLPIVDLGPGAIPIDFDIGRSHVCAVLTGGLVKCWGANNYGQLGLGDNLRRGDEPGEMGMNLPPVNVDATGLTVKKVSLGEFFTCALLSNDQVKCWGFNNVGQSGVGNMMHHGLTPGDTPNKLPVIDFGLSTKTMAPATVKALTSGRAHSCVILDDDSVKCWGFNQFGQLGLGDMNHRGDMPFEMGEALPRVNLGDGRTAVAISAFYDNTCALLDNGALKCWGANDFGQLGKGNLVPIGTQPGQVGNTLTPVDLGTGRQASSVSLGVGFICALLDDTSVKCWGKNGARLGLGDVAHRGDEGMEMGDNLPIVKLFADMW